MTPHGGVSLGSVAGTATGAGALCWVLLSLWRGQGGAPPELPWAGALPLLLVAGAVLVAGWQVRRSVGTVPAASPRAFGRDARTPPAPGRPRRVPMAPQRARGTLVAAQASALGGAALLGWYVANAVLHLANADVPSVRELLVRALVSAAAALLLAVAGLVAQAWCRLPPGEQDDEDPPAGLSYAQD